METVGVGELRDRASEIVRRVREENVSFAVILGGEIVARIVPEQRERPTPEDLTAFWQELDQLIADVAAKAPDGLSAADVIRDVRREL